MVLEGANRERVREIPRDFLPREKLEPLRIIPLRDGTSRPDLQPRLLICLMRQNLDYIQTAVTLQLSAPFGTLASSRCFTANCTRVRKKVQDLVQRYEN